jgi:signal peptidase I
MSKRSRALRYYRSYKPQNPFTKLLRILIRIMVVLFVGYYLITGFFLRTYRVETVAAQPAVTPEDSLLTTPLVYGAPLPFVDGEMPKIRSPQRGELVVYSNPKRRIDSTVLRIADPVVRFFTLQRTSLLPDTGPGFGPSHSLLRVVGVPGDTVRMRNYTVLIKPRTGGSFIPERELIPHDYPLLVPQVSSGGGETVPVSGRHDELTLQEGQYLLLPDNRSFAAAARVWQPTAERHIVDKVLVRYWPEFTRF